MMEAPCDEPVDLTNKIAAGPKKNQRRKSVIVACKSKKKENAPQRKIESEKKKTRRNTKKDVKCRRDSTKIIAKFIQKIKKSKNQTPSGPTYQYIKPRLYLYNPRKKDHNQPRKSNEIKSPSSSPESNRSSQVDLTADQRILLDKIDVSGLQLADNHLERQLSRESGILKGYEGVLDKFTKLSSSISDGDDNSRRLQRVEQSLKKIVALKRETEKRLTNCKNVLKTVTDHQTSLVRIVKNCQFPAKLLKNTTKKDDVMTGSNVSAGASDVRAILRKLIPLSQSPDTSGLDYDSDPGRFVDVCTKN